jgi:RimJ/RimL family protein N-acetyltransferase
MSLRLRPVTEADLPILFEHQRDPEAALMAAFSPRDADAFLEHWRRIIADPSKLALAITDEKSVLGYVASFDGDDARLLGYWIGREYWGRGIGRSAVALFLETEMTRPLYAHVVRTNVASVRILERCEFKIVGSTLAAAPTGGDEIEELVFRLD